MGRAPHLDPERAQHAHQQSASRKHSKYTITEESDISSAIHGASNSRTSSQNKALDRFTKDLERYADNMSARGKILQFTPTLSYSDATLRTISALLPYRPELKAAGLAVTSHEQKNLPRKRHAYNRARRARGRWSQMDGQGEHERTSTPDDSASSRLVNHGARRKSATTSGVEKSRRRQSSQIHCCIHRVRANVRFGRSIMAKPLAALCGYTVSAGTPPRRTEASSVRPQCRVDHANKERLILTKLRDKPLPPLPEDEDPADNIKDTLHTQDGTPAVGPAMQHSEAEVKHPGRFFGTWRYVERKRNERGNAAATEDSQRADLPSFPNGIPPIAPEFASSQPLLPPLFDGPQSRRRTLMSSFEEALQEALRKLAENDAFSSKSTRSPWGAKENRKTGKAPNILDPEATRRRSNTKPPKVPPRMSSILGCLRLMSPGLLGSPGQEQKVLKGLRVAVSAAYDKDFDNLVSAETGLRVRRFLEDLEPALALKSKAQAHG